VPYNHLRDLLADGEHRIQSDHRLLEDHCDFGAAYLAQGLLVHRGNLVPGNTDLARDARMGWRQQAH
jgi:hypothetical protein